MQATTIRAMTTDKTFETNEGVEKSKPLFNRAILKYLVWIGIMTTVIVIISMI